MQLVETPFPRNLHGGFIKKFFECKLYRLSMVEIHMSVINPEIKFFVENRNYLRVEAVVDFIDAFVTCKSLDLQNVLDQFGRKLLFIHSLCLREKTVPNREYFISTNMAGRSSVNIRVISQFGVIIMIWWRVSLSSSS